MVQKFNCPHCQGSILLDAQTLAGRVHRGDLADARRRDAILEGVIAAGEPPAPPTYLTDVFDEENSEKGGTPMSNETEKPEGESPSEQPPVPSDSGSSGAQTEQPAGEPAPAAQEEPKAE